MMERPLFDIRPVKSKRDLDRFIDLPTRLQADDPAYVAPLKMERRQALSAKTNPFFHYADVQLWLAFEGDEVVGRISAQSDRRLPGIGHFGMLAGKDDPALFKALFTTAEAWLAARGLTRIQGPFNLSINEEIGVLVDGFDTPPMLLMGHDQRHVAERIAERGYAQVKDVYAYLYSTRGKAPKWLDRMTGRALPKRVTLRQLDWKRYDEDLAAVVDIFNDAWSDNWGFLPLAKDELDALAKALKPLVHKELVQIIDVEGRPAGFGICLPNLNEAIRDLRGSLLPFGWAKLLWRLKISGVKSARVPLMGFRREFAKTQIGGLLPFLVIGRLREEAAKLGMAQVEFSWVLEDNLPMRHVCEALAGPPYKTYRIFEKVLPA